MTGVQTCALPIFLNHPHFKGCCSIEDIQKKIASVDDLNGRFGESESSDEEEYREEEVIVERENIFLD